MAWACWARTARCWARGWAWCTSGDVSAAFAAAYPIAMGEGCEFHDERLVLGGCEACVGVGRKNDIAGEGVIEARQLVLHVAEGFAQGALDAVAFDGVADALADGEAYAPEGSVVGGDEGGERAALFFHASGIDGLVFQVMG